MWKCGTNSNYRAAMAVAIIDITYTAVVLVLFVLGTSYMVSFEFPGSITNATQVLDGFTDGMFGELPQAQQIHAQHVKNVAEDMGVFLIIMFLAIVDFVISCIFLDGVKTKDIVKCHTWFHLRLVILIIFEIVVFINVTYGSSWYRCIPDAVLTIYRLIGIYIGHSYLQELRASITATHQCRYCHGRQCIPPEVVIDLSDRRKGVQKGLKESSASMKESEDPTDFAAPRKSSGKRSPYMSLQRKLDLDKSPR